MKSIQAAALAFSGLVLGAPWPNPPGYQPPYHGPGGLSPLVNVKNGSITGVYKSNYNQDYFLGVPFAQPPVGELRFRVPQSINSTYGSTYAANQYAPICVGYGGDDLGYPVSEDCLYLNVIRPSGYEGQDLPVGVWIHGGGLSMGGTQDKRYNGTFIVQNSVENGKPIIFVSIAYRLSAWGFLASQEVSGSGNTNLGLRDQRLALHWLQENIAAFGGDPKKVTIWGESAGAGSVGWHLTAYNGRDDGLFRAGIMESGNPVPYSSYRTDEQYQPLYDSILNQTGCANATDNLDCLRQLPYNQLNAVLNQTNFTSSFQPIVDGDFVARFGSIQLAEGAFVKVPIIDGANTDEGTSFGPTGVNSTQDFISDVTNPMENAYLQASFVPDLLAAYPVTESDFIPNDTTLGGLPFPAEEVMSTNGDEYRRSAAYWGDVVMIANRRGTCQTWAANGVDAYCYRFNTRPNGVPWYIGVPHFQEVAFVFDNTQGLGYDALHGTVNPFGGKPQSYLNLAELMSKSWASFIADLDPNGFQGRNAASPAWPTYDNGNPLDIVFDANLTALAAVEPDTFRSSGIEFILSHALAYHR